MAIGDAVQSFKPVYNTSTAAGPGNELVPPKIQYSNGQGSGDWAFFEEPYMSFSGADIVATLVVPNEPKPMTLGELQTISYSIHRENSPVRTLGHVNPIGFVKGPRTIAGSLIFTVFNKYAFYRLEQYKRQVSQGLYALADMLPPFDISISFAHETGTFSKMKIFGVSIVDEGQTMSIDDMVTEQTYTFMARGIQPMTAYLPDGLKYVEDKHAKRRLRPILEVR